MITLIPIQYHNRKYPFGISPQVREVAAHFDIESVDTSFPCSLHTEYSYGKRALSGVLMERLPTIRDSHRSQVPRLWFNDKWAQEFAKFITQISESGEHIRIIEIHPPFDDYCSSLADFIELYMIFEERISSEYPNVEILLENRSGTMYRGGRFLISKNADIIALAEILDKSKIKLRLVLDIPQLFTAHFDSMEFTENDISEVLQPLVESAEYIRSLHVWGKKQNKAGRWNSHVGDFNTYFGHNESKKEFFLAELYCLFNDQQERYFVPEVNSNDEDLRSIVTDLRSAGFQFLT
jgi:hypothetical protein